MTSLPRPSQLPVQPGVEPAPDPGASAVYLFLEPLVVGRSVVDVWPLHPEGRRRLERAGARRVLAVAPQEPPLPLEDGAVDVVLCLSRFSSLQSRADRRRWLAELARVMTPEGFCVLRAQCVASEAGAPDLDEAALTKDALVNLLGEHFGRADIVAETPFLGVSFFAPGTEDIAVNEEFTQLAAVPLHNLVFCSRSEHATWQLAESLLVPVEGRLAELEAAAARAPALESESTRLRAEVARLEALVREVAQERDSLRETAMTYQDQHDGRDAVLAALRREAARHLKQISEDATALEMATLERERAERRAERAEQTVAELEVSLKRREVEVAGLERELTRLRGRKKVGAP